MRNGRLARKIWAVMLAAALLLTAMPAVWAADVPANERVYYTDFQDECDLGAPNVWGYNGDNATISRADETYEGDYAIRVDGNTNQFAGFCLYRDVKLYNELKPSTSYVFTAMMKVLPDNDQTVSVSPQLTWRIGDGNAYAYSKKDAVSDENASVTSAEGWKRIYIPFTTDDKYNATERPENNPATDREKFYFQGRCDQVNEDIHNVYLLDDVAVYIPHPVAMTDSTIANDEEDVSANSITFSFNNVMDDTTVTNLANYELTGNSISGVVKNDDGSYTATFGSALTAGEQHTFTMSDLKDELGQTLEPVSITFTAAQETEPVDPPEPEAPGANQLVYKNTFSDERPEHIAWCFGVEATISKSTDAYSGSSAVKITYSPTATENIAGMRLYKDTGFYDLIEADKNYVFSIMMKALPYSDGSTDYPVTYTTQIKPGNLDYQFGNPVSSDGEWHRVLIPFNTEGYLGLNGTDGNFNFQVWTARENLGNDQLPADVTRFAEYIVDDFALYEVAPVALIQSSIADGADNVSAAAEGITFSFNNVMDDTTVTNLANYTLTGNSISQVVKNEDNSYTATFASPLVENTSYTFGISGLKDELQQEMAAANISFTTAEIGVSTTPEYNAINVKTDAAMTVRFDSAVTALSADNVLVNGEKAHVSSVSMNSANEAVITFAGLDYGTLYKVTLTGITGTTGKVMDDYTTQFVTELESKVVYENRFVEDEDFIFPKWRDSGCIPNARNDAEYVSAPYSVLMQPTNTNRDLYFSEYYATFVPGKTYRVSVMAKSTAEENQGFRLLANVDEQIILDTGKLSTEWKEYSATFVQPDNPNPGRFQNYDNVPYYIDDLIITEVAPTQVLPNSDIVDGAQDVSVNGPYTLYFNNAMDTASLTGANITINGAAVKVTGTTKNTVTFTPAAALAYDSINKLAVHVKDASGADVSDAATFQAEGMFTIGQMQLLSGGAAVTDNTLAPDTVYTATLPSLTNNSGSTAGAVLVVAFYDDGVMVASAFADVSLESGASIAAPLTVQITSPASFAGTPTLKAFLWSGFDNIDPIADAIAATGAAE